MFRDAHVKTSPRHRQWLNGELQPEVPVPEQPPGLTYNASNVPTRITFGVSALCPRCKGVVKVSRKTKARDTRSRDPYRPEKVCPRCDGWGIVPNQSV